MSFFHQQILTEALDGPAYSLPASCLQTRRGERQQSGQDICALRGPHTALAGEGEGFVGTLSGDMTLVLPASVRERKLHFYLWFG